MPLIRAIDTPVTELSEFERETLEALVARLLSASGATYERQLQLETALRTRIVIEQAKGVVAERLNLSMSDAFELIRRSARNRCEKLHDVAETIVQDRSVPSLHEFAPRN